MWTAVDSAVDFAHTSTGWFHSLNGTIQSLNPFCAHAIKVEPTIYELLQQHMYVFSKTTSYRLKKQCIHNGYSRHKNPRVVLLLLAGKQGRATLGFTMFLHHFL